MILSYTSSHHNLKRKPHHISIRRGPPSRAKSIRLTLGLERTPDHRYANSSPVRQPTLPLSLRAGPNSPKTVDRGDTRSSQKRGNSTGTRGLFAVPTKLTPGSNRYFVFKLAGVVWFQNLNFRLCHVQENCNIY